MALGLIAAVVVLILSAASATSAGASPLHFGVDDGSARALVALHEAKAYRMLIDPHSQFAIVAVNDSSVDVTLNLAGHPVVVGSHSSGLSYAIASPAVMANACANVPYNSSGCPIDIVLGGAAPSPSVVELRAFRGDMIQTDQLVSGVLARTRSKRYGVELHRDSLPALIQVRPDPDNARVDVDVFVYHESMPFNYVYPNQYMRNHRWNYVEEFTITEDGGFWRDGLYIVEVYASCDTDEDTNPYDVTVYTAVNDSFALTILGISMALFLAVSGVVFMILAIYQHRRRAIRMARLQQLAALRHGTGARHVHRGATPEQVEAIPLKDFLSLSLDEEDCKCAICLCDYVMSDKLRQITCGHHFHKDCLGEWLQQHHVCPLCQQDITTARDCRSRQPSPLSASMAITLPKADVPKRQMSAQSASYEPLPDCDSTTESPDQ